MNNLKFFVEAKAQQYAKEITRMIDDVGLIEVDKALQGFGYKVDLKVSIENAYRAASIGGY